MVLQGQLVARGGLHVSHRCACMEGGARSVFACAAGSCPCVYTPVHPTRHIYNIHAACRNVYDSLLNIIMGQFVSMN